MFVECCVPGCYNNSNKRPKTPITFHGFPDSLELLEKWRTAINVKKSFFMENFHLAICSEHFQASDFVIQEESDEPLLKPDAIPSSHLPTKYKEIRPRPPCPKVYSNKSKHNRHDTNISWNGLQQLLIEEKRNWTPDSPSSSDNPPKRFAHEVHHPESARHFILVPVGSQIINQLAAPNYTQICMQTPCNEQPVQEQPSIIEESICSSSVENWYPQNKTAALELDGRDILKIKNELDSEDLSSETSNQDIEITQVSIEQLSTVVKSENLLCFETPCSEQPEQPSNIEESICSSTVKNWCSQNLTAALESDGSEFLKIKNEPPSEDLIDETSNQDIEITQVSTEQLSTVVKSENLLCFETPCSEQPVQEQPEQPSNIEEGIYSSTVENWCSQNLTAALESDGSEFLKIKNEPPSEDLIDETSNQDIENTQVSTEQLFTVIKSENLLCFETLAKESQSNSDSVETIVVSDVNTEQPPTLIKSENLLCFETLAKESQSNSDPVETIVVSDVNTEQPSTVIKSENLFCFETLAKETQSNYDSVETIVVSDVNTEQPSTVIKSENVSCFETVKESQSNSDSVETIFVQDEVKVPEEIK